MHGTGGEWWVDNQRLHWDLLDHWSEAAQAWGLPAVTDFNTGTNEGVGYYRVNQRGGWRMNTAKAFLRTAKAPGLKVETHAHTRRVLAEGGRAVGVEYEQGGAVKTARARDEVILSAGAIGSPQILQVSGLGPAAQLRRHGIAVQRDCPQVGANLQDHLQLRSAWRLNGALTLNTLANCLWGKATVIR